MSHYLARPDRFFISKGKKFRDMRLSRGGYLVSFTFQNVIVREQSSFHFTVRTRGVERFSVLTKTIHFTGSEIPREADTPGLMDINRYSSLIKKSFYFLVNSFHRVY